MDRRAQVVAMVNASQEAALAAHDAELANAVDNLPIGNLTLHPSTAEPPSPGADTLFSRTKKLMFHLKDIESDLISLRAKLVAIGDAPPQPDDNTLLYNIAELSLIRQAVSEQRTKLIPMAASKIAAVVESYRAVTMVNNSVFLLLKATTQSWEGALQKCIAETQACAGSTFNCGGSTNLNPVLLSTDKYLCSPALSLWLSRSSSISAGHDSHDHCLSRHPLPTLSWYLLAL